ncbi:MAG: sensor histidine kinase [Anaerolineae bacterium]|jgi:signal transduction histidine kinase
MDPICAFFSSHLIEIYFFYGLAFFITGVVVSLEASRHSSLSLAQTLPFLAAFGLLHGTHEWLEMFEKMAAEPVGAVPRLFRLSVLIVSFTPLVEFGLRLGALTGNKRWRMARWIILAIFLGGAGLIMLRWGHEGRQTWIPALDGWCRYSLAVPGAVLAAIGLLGYASGVTGIRGSMPCDLKVVALAFLLYGVPGQVFVGASVLPPSTVINSSLFMETLHFPVQLLRTLMATLVVIFMGRGVRCFERERQRRVKELNQDRLEAQRRLTEEMAERKQLQRELLHRTVRAQEEERRHIARELHDETAQALTALSLGLAEVEQAVGEDTMAASSRLAALRELVDDIMRKVNQLTTRLRPTMLDDLGLIPALITYADTLGRHLPFTVDVEVTGDRRRLPSELETTLYRIVQESLTNVARHAQAEHAWVHLDLGPREATLAVYDDGIGMSADRVEEATAQGEGWGLAGLHERAALLGGDVRIRSEPGAGTQIEARIPIPESPLPEEGKVS